MPGFRWDNHQQRRRKTDENVDHFSYNVGSNPDENNSLHGGEGVPRREFETMIIEEDDDAHFDMFVSSRNHRHSWNTVEDDFLKLREPKPVAGCQLPLPKSDFFVDNESAKSGLDRTNDGKEMTDGSSRRKHTAKCGGDEIIQTTAQDRQIIFGECQAEMSSPDTVSKIATRADKPLQCSGVVRTNVSETKLALQQTAIQSSLSMDSSIPTTASTQSSYSNDGQNAAVEIEEAHEDTEEEDDDENFESLHQEYEGDCHDDRGESQEENGEYLEAEGKHYEHDGEGQDDGRENQDSEGGHQEPEGEYQGVDTVPVTATPSIEAVSSTPSFILNLENDVAAPTSDLQTLTKDTAKHFQVPTSDDSTADLSTSTTSEPTSEEKLSGGTDSTAEQDQEIEPIATEESELHSVEHECPTEIPEPPVVDNPQSWPVGSPDVNDRPVLRECCDSTKVVPSRLRTFNRTHPNPNPDHGVPKAHVERIPTVRVVAKRCAFKEVQATDDSCASVAQLSAWLAADPTKKEKEVRHLRKGKNVLAKLQNFGEKDLDILEDEDDGQVAYVLPKKNPIQSEIGGSSVSVSDKKKWLQEAFPKQQQQQQLQRPASKAKPTRSMSAVVSGTKYSDIRTGVVDNSTKRSSVESSPSSNRAKSSVSESPRCEIVHDDAACTMSVSAKRAWLNNAFKKAE